jgi:hypothetical protein
MLEGACPTTGDGCDRTGGLADDEVGPVRALVAMGNAPARWYRSLSEACEDARALAGSAEAGEVVARAWVEAAEGPPDYELKVGARRGLRWARPASLP